MSALEKAPVGSVAIDPHVAAALEFATRSNHPVYDCIYLAVAVHQGMQVVTDDRRFAAAAARLGLSDRIRLLGS